MVYLEYEAYKERFIEAQRIFNDALLEKEKLFTMTQPNAIRYDKDKVQSCPSGSILDNYVIALEEQKIDEKLETFRQLLEDREKLLMLKESDLRKSHDKFDRIYVCRFLEGMNIKKIARVLNYSQSQVYRIFKQIIESINQDAKKCEKKCAKV